VKILLSLLILVSSCSATAFADTGVLIPGDKDKPDPTILSLAEMRVDVSIDNGDARVRIIQIFANHTGKLQEGTYQFALPDGSTLSDFAVWDGPVRIPAIVLERQRADEIYTRAMQQAIDPGLLEMGERTDDPNTTTSLFTAKISPIPAYGTKRMEIEYHQRLTVNDYKQIFLLSLKPDAYEKQLVKRFTLHFDLRSTHPLQDFTLVSKLFPLQLTSSDAHHTAGSFTADNLSLDEDFTARWKLDPTIVDTLDVTTYRTQHVPTPQADEISPGKPAPQPGFFAAQMLLGEGKIAEGKTVSATAAEPPPRTVIILLDTSLSMQWNKLERSYAALQGVLNKLRPSDRFNILLFNQDIIAYEPAPVLAVPAAITEARAMVRSSKLRGGTDLGAALTAGLKQCDAPDSLLIVLTDGGSDRGASILSSNIVANYNAAWRANPNHPHTDIFAVGDDAHTDLLALLARNNGMMQHVTSTEPIDYKLEAFLNNLTRLPATNLALKQPATRLVYPLDDTVFTGSLATWVGLYDHPATNVTFTATGQRGGEPFTATTTADLPATAEEHAGLPRLWAQARVHALLEQIAADGETRAAVDEVIRLARLYKLVTPYTSFLAVPRSLLRPRVIRPGDPVLRVRTDDAIASVIALFPFGRTKPLRHLSDEDSRGPEGGRLWETRFLAPPDMHDGTYTVRLLLRDTHGNTYREQKSFVIASTPPTVKLLRFDNHLHRDQPINLRASASQSTRTLSARLNGQGFDLPPISLRWNPSANANTGTLYLPADLPPGHYNLTLTAEDIAHNQGSEEVPVDVLP
jgi:Ca-activated chloride channel family protein